MNGRPVENSIKTEAEAKIKTHKKFFIQKLEKLERSEFESSKELMRSEMEEGIPLTWEMVPAAAGEDTEQLLKRKRSQIESAPSHNTPSISSESGSGHPSQPPNFNIGRWTEQEHKKFLEAILMYGNEWKKVQKYISTRSSTQARSHAQKFFLRLKKNIKFNEEFSDSTLNLGSRSTLRPIQSSYAHEIKKSNLF
jgi:SHAQKYF class myb-like DNA-binding protein